MLEQLTAGGSASDWSSLNTGLPGLAACAFRCGRPGEALGPKAGPGQYEVLFCAEGEVRIDLWDGRTVRAAEREILLLSGDARIERARLSGGQLRGVLVAGTEEAVREGMARLCALLGSPTPDLRRARALLRACGGCAAVGKIVWSEAVFAGLEELPFNAGGGYGVFKAAELLFLLCGGQLPLAGEKPRARYDLYQLEKVRQVRDYLCGHLGEPITIETLARRFHLSPTLLKTCFRQVHGQPLHKYLLECRLRQAAKLLSVSRLPVAQVAEQVGYRSTSQFGAAFKRRYRLSPLQYRFAAREKSDSDKSLPEMAKNVGGNMIF